MFRKATLKDLSAISAIYDRIHTQEETGAAVIGWIRDIYPTENTAKNAIEAGDLFVCEEGGDIVACGRINQFQDECYREGQWQYPVSPEQVMVLHTLVVDPVCGKKGLGTKFLQFYEDYARNHGCLYLRLDTNARNLRARAFYQKHGYTQVGIVPCEFNGIAGVDLVLLEKKL